MDEGNTLSFCVTCGSRVQTSDRYCPSCGNNPRGGPRNGSYENTQDRYRRQTSKLPLVAILGFIWTALAVISGIQLFLFDFDTYYIINYSSITAQAILLVVSGACAGICATLCLTRKYYTLTLVLCIIGSIVALTFIVGIVGLICAYFIYQGKYYFKEQEESS